MKRAFCIFLAAASAACSSGKGDFGGGDAAAPAVDSGASTNNACAADTYPEGPYGTGVGKIVNPGLSWKGYLPNATDVTTIAPNDLYDCDGSKGIDAIIFDVSAQWCAACQSQAANTPALFTQYDALDIRVVTLVVQDMNQAPATTTTAQQWKQQYGLTDITVAADPTFSFAPLDESSVSLPVTIVVDPRTMKIMQVNQGYIAAYPLAPDPEAVSIAKLNGAGG
jgi:thiol-disulfide isomerase/thioredoxin